jgi:hypothetical protein
MHPSYLSITNGAKVELMHWQLPLIDASSASTAGAMSVAPSCMGGDLLYHPIDSLCCNHPDSNYSTSHLQLPFLSYVNQVRMPIALM